MKLFAETGLPELPEGMFWRVKRWDPSGLLSVTEPSVIVAIIHEFRYELTTRRQIDLGIFSFDWGWETVPKVRSDEVESATVFTEDNVIVPPSSLTPADILRTAERVYKRWQESVEAASLLGDYPPKKLNIDYEEK